MPGYLERLSNVRFTDSYLEPWRSGILPSPRVPDAARKLTAIGLPVLVLHGARDMTFPVALARQAASEIPTATAVILNDAGHMAHVDEPDRWLDAVRNFLNEGR